ncbi:MAG: porin [Betaproteobacteria bacterium]
MNNYKRQAVAFAIGLMLLSGTVHADDPIKRLLDLQLKKGIITQEEYDEFMAETAKDSPPVPGAGERPDIGSHSTSPENVTGKAASTGEAAQVQTDKDKKVEPEKRPSAADNATGKLSSDGQGVALIKTDTLKVELFGTIDLSVGYTSHSLVQSGEMPTSIGPYISGGVRYPRTTPTGPGGSSVPYPASNMSSQVGLFNGALSTSSWGIRASRDIGADGLKAFVILDSAFNPATGQLTDQSHNQSTNSRYPTTAYATSSLNGQLFAKEAVGGFSGDGWGRIKFGRNTNPINDVLGTYAPMQKAGLFEIYGNGVYGAGGGLSENGRVDSSIKYENKYGNVNFGLLYGLGGTGGLKRGAQGFASNIGYETDRFGVQLIYEEFKDLLKTGTDATVSNVIDLTAYDQKALMLVGKVKVTDKLHAQIGIQQARLSEPTPDPNIPFISNIYGEDVQKSTAYTGEDQKINTAHLGFDYDFSEKLNASAAYMYVGFPKYDFGKPVGGVFPSHYLGGAIDAWGGLVTYRLYKGTTLYTGALFTHYRGPAFESNSTTIYVHDIFTAATGFRFKF